MTWEVGKFYKLGNGTKAVIYEIYKNEIHGAKFPIGNTSPDIWRWDIDGFNSHRGHNLTTEPWTEPVKPLEWEGEVDVEDDPNNPNDYMLTGIKLPKAFADKRFHMTLKEKEIVE